LGLQALQSLSAGERQKVKADRARETALDHEALVWVLSALSQLFGIPFDSKLVVGQFSPPYGFDTVARAADSLGLRAGWKNLPASRLKKLVAPFVVTLLPIFREPRQFNLDTSPDPGVPNARFALVLRIDEGRVAFFEQGVAGHTILPLAEFESRYAGMVLQAVPKSRPLADVPAGSTESQPACTTCE